MTESTYFREILEEEAALVPSAVSGETSGNRKRPGNLPRIWLILGNNPGEVGQLRVLARALGWPCTEKFIARSPLIPARDETWPDLVISFGKGLRAARQVVACSDRRTVLVHLGRPRWARSDSIDLIIPMPQDRVPPASNVLQIRVSFNHRDPLGDDGTSGPSDPRWHDLPTPRTAVLVGGATRHFRFDEDDARRLGMLASQHANARKGSLLVTTSPRTSQETMQALRASLRAPHFFYEYRCADLENPLPVWLKYANDLIVTGDTASMLAEAWRTGRPVQVMPLRTRSTPMRQLLATLQRGCPTALYRALLSRGIVAAPVDLSSWLAERIADGDFAVLGDVSSDRRRKPRVDDDLGRAVARIKQLLAVDS